MKKNQKPKEAFYNISNNAITVNADNPDSIEILKITAQALLNITEIIKKQDSRPVYGIYIDPKGGKINP